MYNLLYEKNPHAMAQYRSETYIPPLDTFILFDSRLLPVVNLRSSDPTKSIGSTTLAFVVLQAMVPVL